MSGHIRPYILRVLVHRGHAYSINANIPEFDQTVATLYQQQQDEPLSTHYSIRENFNCADDKVINNFDEIFEYIVAYKGEQTFVKIICDLIIRLVPLIP